MKLLLTGWLILLISAAFSQGGFLNIASVSSTASTEELVPDILAQNLTATCKNDEQKVKAIFYWITDNIAYRSYSLPNKQGIRTKYTSDAWIDTAARSLNEIVAYEVLKKKTAVCDGYARLFKTLCDYAGIRSEIITGYARTNSGRASTKFRSNHSWNAVCIDSTWHLLDATWASGYFTYNTNEFVKHYDNSYFLTPPKSFVLDHYPEDLQWTLLDQPPTLREFYHTPFKYAAFLKYTIHSFVPDKGIIEAYVGDTVQIALDVLNKERDKKIASDSVFDTTQTSTSSAIVILPLSEESGTTMKYRYIVSSPYIQWLQLVYNNDVVMRYKLVIKEGKKE
jgi:transglutaminase/protease-like cytokinesis protein 3